MKKLMKLATVATFALFITSCNKNKCYQCETTTRTVNLTVRLDNYPSITDTRKIETRDTTYNVTSTETICDMSKDDKLKYEILGTSNELKSNGKTYPDTLTGWVETFSDHSTTCH